MFTDVLLTKSDLVCLILSLVTAFVKDRRSYILIYIQWQEKVYEIFMVFCITLSENVI